MKINKAWWLVRGLLNIIKVNIKEGCPMGWLKERESAEIRFSESNSTRIAFDDFYQFWQLNPYRWHCRPFYAYYDEEVVKIKEPEHTRDYPVSEGVVDFQRRSKMFPSLAYGGAYRLSDDKPLLKSVSCKTMTIRKGEIYVTFSPIDLIIYQGWRNAVKASYRAEEKAHNRELDKLQKAHSQALKDNTFMRLLKGVQEDINDTNDQALMYYEQASEYLEQIQEEINNE